MILHPAWCCSSRQHRRCCRHASLPRYRCEPADPCWRLRAVCARLASSALSTLIISICSVASRGLDEALRLIDGYCCGGPSLAPGAPTTPACGANLQLVQLSRVTACIPVLLETCPAADNIKGLVFADGALVGPVQRLAALQHPQTCMMECLIMGNAQALPFKPSDAILGMLCRHSTTGCEKAS